MPTMGGFTEDLARHRLPMRIVLCYITKPAHLKQIAAVAPEAEIVDASQEQIAAEIFSADMFCGHAKVPIDWDGVVRQGRLRWIQSSAAGMDHCLVPSVVKSDIAVSSASGGAGRPSDGTYDRLDHRLDAEPADVLPGTADQRVHPPPHARANSQHGRYSRSWRRRPAAGADARGL